MLGCVPTLLATLVEESRPRARQDVGSQVVVSPQLANNRIHIVTVVADEEKGQKL